MHRSLPRSCPGQLAWSIPSGSISRVRPNEHFLTCFVDALRSLALRPLWPSDGLVRQRLRLQELQDARVLPPEIPWLAPGYSHGLPLSEQPVEGRLRHLSRMQAARIFWPPPPVKPNWSLLQIPNRRKVHRAEVEPKTLNDRSLALWDWCWRLRRLKTGRHVGQLLARVDAWWWRCNIVPSSLRPEVTDALDSCNEVPLPWCKR
mmetsp:Transcript_25918/g.56827  ORF Transcript_25918/g.56827 Transcript_25918/m.56827 type:complete len:204 (-) Transcript_25918:160-771(-)